MSQAGKTPLGPPLENPVVRKVYEQDNYKIIEEPDKGGDLCAIYFSSNGIYEENTVETFTKVIVEKDRYEWMNNRFHDARKHIFIRDITKDMYQNGISAKMNTMHKVMEFLREETKGYRVVTVGSSSGGYCASMAGVVLNAERVYSFTGQFSMYISLFQVPYGPVKKFDLRNEELYPPEKIKYYDLLEYMKTCNVPIFYFSSLQKQDLVQLNLVKHQFNVFTFEMKSHEHRLPVYVFNFNVIMNMDPARLKQLGEKYVDKKLSRFWFSVEIMGFGRTVSALWRQYWKKAKRSLFD